jgi:hypothetical protein
MGVTVPEFSGVAATSKRNLLLVIFSSAGLTTSSSSPLLEQEVKIKSRTKAIVDLIIVLFIYNLEKLY